MTESHFLFCSKYVFFASIPTLSNYFAFNQIDLNILYVSSKITLGKLMDVVGRKRGLIVSQVLSLIGWIVVCASFDVATVCVGRFVCGMAAAATALICKLRKFETIEKAK